MLNPKLKPDPDQNQTSSNPNHDPTPTTCDATPLLPLPYSYPLPQIRDMYFMNLGPFLNKKAMDIKGTYDEKVRLTEPKPKPKPMIKPMPMPNPKPIPNDPRHEPDNVKPNIRLACLSLSPIILGLAPTLTIPRATCAKSLLGR